MKKLLRHLEVKDLKETRQRQTVENRLIRLEKKEKEIQEQEDKEFLEPFKSDWRSTLTESEWYAIAGSGPTNSVSQTFAYGDPASGIEVTLSGLGGVEAHPSTVTIDGETYDAPTYNQLAMQGYAKPLGFNVNRRTDFQDVNPYLDASQEFAQRVGADYMMNARVQQTIRQEVETDLTKIAAKFDSSLIENMGQNIKLAVEAIMNGQQPPLVAPPDPPFTGMSYEQMVDEQNKVNDKYNNLIAPLQKELDSYAGQLAPAGLVAKINALVEKQSQETNALYEKNLKDNQEYGDLLAKRADEWGKFVNAIEDYRKGFNFKSPSQEVAYDSAGNYNGSAQGLKAATNVAGGTAFNPSLTQIGSRGKGLGGVVKLGKHGTSDKAAAAIRKGGFKAGSSSNVYGTRNIFLDPTKSGKAASDFAASSQAAVDAGGDTLGRTARQRAADLAAGKPGTGTVLPVAYKPGTGPRMNIPGTKYAEVSASADKATQGLRMTTNYPNSAKAAQLVRTGATTAKVTGARAVAKTLGKAVPFAGAAISVADAGARFSQGDIAGGLMSGLTAVPGPVGWAALGTQIGYDAARSGNFKGGQTRRGQGSRFKPTRKTKKKQNESTVWDRTKKHLKGA